MEALRRIFVAAPLLFAASACTTPAFRSPSLAPMIGRWEGNAETTVAATGQVAKVRITTIAGWARVDEVMVERSVTKVPGEPSWASVSVWVRTEELGGWKTYMVNTAGLTEAGFASWDAQNRAWNLEARSVNAATGQETAGRGFIRFAMNDRRDHEWVVRDADGSELFRVLGETKRIR
jgi:hypothetical protein